MDGILLPVSADAEVNLWRGRIRSISHAVDEAASEQIHPTLLLLEHTIHSQRGSTLTKPVPHLWWRSGTGGHWDQFSIAQVWGNAWLASSSKRSSYQSQARSPPILHPF